MANWEEQAQCKGMSPNLFTIAHLGDVEVAFIGDLDTDKYNKLKRYNRKKMARAIEHCRGCPVWAECLDSATEEDRKFTVRGGFEPEGFEPLAPKPSKPKIDGRSERGKKILEEKIKNPCPKCGEMDWKLTKKYDRSNMFAQCQTCYKARRRETYQKNAEAERLRNQSNYQARVEG